MYYYAGHLILAFSWAIFLLTFIKSMQNKNLTESKVFGVLSLIAMIAVLIVGTKMMLNNHEIIKSGKWIHVKLSLDIILMIENLFLLKLLKQGKFVSSKCGNIMYIFSYISFMVMIALTMLQPF
jgi:uncharacterized membrane protein